MRIILFTFLALLSSNAYAAERMSDEDLNAPLELGEEIEARVDGDLNNDGHNDLAYVVGSPDNRTLYVLMAKPAGKKLDYTLVGKAELDKPALTPAKLSITKDVLKLDEDTGATTAMAATYRYRLNAQKERMQLIGLDAKLYSSIFEHDGDEISWNLLTGQMMMRKLVVTVNGAEKSYENKFENNFKWVSNPVYMEENLEPEMLMITLKNRP